MVILDEEEENILVQDQHGNQILMNDEGIAIISIKDITIEAAENINIIAGTDISAESGANTSIAASAAFKGEGATAEVSSSGNTVIKGSVVQIN